MNVMRFPEAVCVASCIVIGVVVVAWEVVQKGVLS